MKILDLRVQACAFGYTFFILSLLYGCGKDRPKLDGYVYTGLRCTSSPSVVRAYTALVYGRDEGYAVAVKSEEQSKILYQADPENSVYCRAIGTNGKSIPGFADENEIVGTAPRGAPCTVKAGLGSVTFLELNQAQTEMRGEYKTDTDTIPFTAKCIIKNPERKIDVTQ